MEKSFTFEVWVNEFLKQYIKIWTFKFPKVFRLRANNLRSYSRTSIIILFINSYFDTNWRLIRKRDTKVLLLHCSLIDVLWAIFTAFTTKTKSQRKSFLALMALSPTSYTPKTLLLFLHKIRHKTSSLKALGIRIQNTYQYQQ